MPQQPRLSQVHYVKLNTLTYTPEEKKEMESLGAIYRVSVSWQINIASVLDNDGSDDGSDSDADGDLAAVITARCTMNQAIKDKLSPKKKTAGP